MSAIAPVSLSPSRANDFKICPLMYRLRAIDRLPEPVTPAQVRGTLVHAVLEQLYDVAAERRTPQQAAELVAPAWRRLRDDDPEAAGLFTDAASADEEEWLASVHRLVAGYFEMEDPTRLAPAERECLVEADTADGTRLRGYIDRLDVAPTGEIRVVDYKTGASPAAAFVGEAMFQLKFYALLLLRTRGTVPTLLRLMYLKDRQMVDYRPTEAELRGFERTVVALWRAIQAAVADGDFRPRRNPLCGWCSFRQHCPEFGGTPPPYPLDVARP